MDAIINNDEEMVGDVIDLSRKESLDLLYYETKNSIDLYQEGIDRGDKAYELPLYEAQNRHDYILKIYEANGLEVPVTEEEKAKVA